MNAGVHVERLQLRARAARIGALRSALDTADWPQAGEAIVIVRRLSARAATPQAIAARATAQLAQQLREAVAADSPLAAHAPAVRFASAAALYAQLALDLYRGRAAHCWYWARWRHWLALPVPQAIASVLGSEPLQLAAITAELERHAVLASLWQALSPPAAARLTAELAEASALPAVTAPIAQHTDPATVPLNADALPPALLRRWRAPCHGLPADDARVRLALQLVLLEWRPALLHDAAVCAALLQRLAPPELPAGAAPRPVPPPTADAEEAATAVHTRDVAPPVRPTAAPNGQATAADAVTTSPPTAAPRAVPASAPPPERHSVRPAPPTAAVNEALDAIPASPVTPRAAAASPASRRARAETAVSATASAPAAPAPTATVAASFAASVANAELLSDYGGTLYLLNVLNDGRLQQALGGACGIDLRSGWHWLLSLASTLGLTADDALYRWLQARWQAHHACAEDWQPRPDDAPVVALAARLCGPRLWTPELIAGPGRLRWTPTHLDLQRPLGCVSLAVRCAGLDIDPGWLPWLGRVVHFHYLERWP